MDTLKHTLNNIVAFRDTRDWQQFHTPQNLAAALSIEASELQEAMLWMTDAEANQFVSSPAGRDKVCREIADVLIFALLFCHKIGIDPIKAIQEKLAENSTKYPSELARGKATKYTDLKPNSD